MFAALIGVSALVQKSSHLGRIQKIYVFGFSVHGFSLLISAVDSSFLSTLHTAHISSIPTL